VVAVVSAPAPNMSTRIESNWSSVEIKEFTIIVYVIRVKSPPTISSTNKTDRHDKTEILLRVALNRII
jgi:hypothetical protein